MDDNSGRIEELTTEIDDLRALRNSRGYALLVTEIKEIRETLVAALIKIDPTDVSKIGRQQGGILSYDYITGDGEQESFVTLMIEGRQAEIDDAKPRTRR